MAIAKQVNDSGRKQRLISALETFSSTLCEFIEVGQRMNFKENQLVRSRTITREELNGSTNAIMILDTKVPWNTLSSGVLQL